MAGGVDPVGCGPALEFLIRHKVASRDHLARLPAGDAAQNPGSEVCGGGACCVPDVTEALKDAGRASLSQVVKSTADTLHATISARRAAFHGVVEAALANSEQRAVMVVEATYPRVAGAARDVLGRLYAGLRAGLTDQDSSALNTAFDAFWDDFFPPVYHSVLHAHLPPFTHRYAQCLREAQSAVRPWGVIPTLLGEPLLRALHSARLLLHALDVGTHVLEAARSLPVSPECGEAAARLRYCGACHGALAPPCPGLCLNVARGCLAPLAEVDAAWTDLAGAATRVQEALAILRLDILLAHLPDKLSEAVMVALERGPQLQKKVRRDCSSPSYEEGHPTQHQPPPAEGAEELTSGGSDGITVEGMKEAVRAAVGALEGARHWWAGLPETHCRSIASQDTHCWNGMRVAPYTKTTAGVGISAQKYNPEIRLERPDTTVYTLADRLRVVRRVVMKQLSWLPKADSQRSHNYGRTDGSGSGVDMMSESRSHSEYPTNDDEEYSPDRDYYTDYYNDNEGSAEGSGEHELIPTTMGEKDRVNKEVLDADSSSHPVTSICLLMATLTAAILMLR